jgi:tungstate transport system ATP-binding protein
MNVGNSENSFCGEDYLEAKNLSVHLQLSEIKKCYNGIKALDSISLEMDGGKIIVLLGVNGAGKTTFMRILAGLENADSGQILFNSQKIAAKALCQVSTLVFQKTSMFTMNVYDNLAYGLKIRKVSKEEIAKKIPEALQEVRLSGFEKRRAKKLSGGEQQRIALARAFLLEPNILFLDEPTANLDPNSATIIEKAIVSKKSSQRIIIMATHNLNQARRMGDEIVHIHDGEIVEVAKPEDFFLNPKSEITRKFIHGELDF